MKAEYYFKVANSVFGLLSDFRMEMGRVLPSYQNFVIKEPYPDLFTMRLHTIPQDFAVKFSFPLVLEETNDMGHLMLYKGEDRYCLATDYSGCGNSHVMFASLDFKELEVFIRLGDPYWGDSLNSMIRFAFSQAILLHGGVSIHASTVCVNDNAYLFMGRSGTGKSTHASLWKRYIPGAWLLNDDNPTIRLKKDGRVMIYGTPWSGKTPCYLHESAELKGGVHLYQALENRFTRLAGLDAFLELLPGCMAFPDNSLIYAKMCDLLEAVVNSSVVIGRMECRPEKEAAFLCYENMK